MEQTEYKMKVLQLYYKVPFPADDGGAVSLLSSTNSLIAVNCDVTILAIDQVKDTSERSLSDDSFLKRTRFSSVKVDNRVTAFGAFKAIVKNESYFSIRFFSAHFENKLKEVLKNSCFDIIQLEHLYLLHYLDCIKEHSKAVVVLRSQNVEHLLWRSVIKTKRNFLVKKWLSHEVKKLEKIESTLGSRIDGIAAISEDDATYFARRTQIPVSSISVSQKNTLSLYNQTVKSDCPIRFYHLGSMDWQPNVTGINWFFKEIVSLLDLPDHSHSIHFSGKHMPAYLLTRNDQRIFYVTDRVADASEFIEDKNVLLVPLLSGGGVRIKIIEAIARQKIVISTSEGCKGLPSELIKYIEVADLAAGFAQKMKDVIQNREYFQKRAQLASRLIPKYFGEIKIGSQFVSLYEQIIAYKLQKNRNI